MARSPQNDALHPRTYLLLPVYHSFTSRAADWFNVLCNKDKALYKYMLAWLCTKIRAPWTKMQSMLVFYGYGGLWFLVECCCFVVRLDCKESGSEQLQNEYWTNVVLIILAYRLQGCGKNVGIKPYIMLFGRNAAVWLRFGICCCIHLRFAVH